MSGSENKQHGAEQACQEPGSEPLEGQTLEDHGGKQASEPQPACEKVEQSPREKGEPQSVRKADNSSSGKGEQSVCEKGEQKSVCDANKSESEEGRQSVSEQKNTPDSEQEKTSVEVQIDWRLKCDKAWTLSEDSIPTPENLDWKDIYHKRPFGRNFLKSSNPEGLSTNEPPPPGPADVPAPREPLEAYGDFSGWKVSTEHIPVDTSRIPPGVVVCYLPNYSWCIKEQLIDLVSEGLWAELLDSFQPEICILDWYEDSKLHQFVYELHVKLLGADKSTVIQEFSLTPEDSMSGDSTGWKNVSHAFKAYGPGVRFVHFLHKSKDLFVVGFHRTRLTNTTVFVKLRE